MIKILLIEDDLEFCHLIKDFLSQRGMDVTIYDDPFKVLVTGLKQYDLVLLDLGLPGFDGIDICKKFREKSDIPIIISTARGEVSDKVLGLDVGADDYLPKPYDPNELEARIRSLLRRAENKSDSTVDEFVIDEQNQDVKYLGDYLHLTQKEFQIFRVLLESKNTIIPKDRLKELSDVNGLEMTISRVRAKLATITDREYIVSHRGKGYQLVK